MASPDFQWPSVWGECQECRLVFEGWEPLSEDRPPCPYCGSDTGLPWPGMPAELLLRKAFAQEPEDYEDLAVMAMLVAIAVEVIVEATLAGAIESRAGQTRAGQRVMYAVIDTDLRVDQRLKMIEAITDVDYRTVARQLGERSFPRDWEDLRKRRNQFVHHGDSYAFEPDSELHLMSIARSAAKVFAEVTNIIWRGSVANMGHE